MSVRAMFERLAPVLLCLVIASPASAGWEVQWIDRFDGDGVNWNNWTAQTQANYNNEVQCYTDDDSSPERNYEVSNGTLKIIARRGGIDCPGLGGQSKSWTSGRINSKDKAEFLYGRVEARIRFHNLQGGTWPAFWMLENRIDEQPIAGDGDNVGWPNPGASEIDVWEWFSNEPESYIINFFNTGGFGCGFEKRHEYPGGPSDVLDWHVYAMEWTADGATFFMDGEEVASYNLQACDVYEEPMFILLNVAMGGNLGGTIEPGFSTATMEVDYVAHCQESETSTATGCNEDTPVAFDFAADADGQWVTDEEGFAGNGQGFGFDYLAFADLLFVAWFTYVDPDAIDPAAGQDAVGALDNRWLTAQLTIEGSSATGPVFASSGGRFDSPPQPGQQTVEVGSMTVEFVACDQALVRYDIAGTPFAREISVVPLEKRINGDFRCRSELSASS